MPFLVVGAATLRATRFRKTAGETGGTLRRTLSGQLRGDSLWSARNWEAEVVCTDDAAATAVYSAADGGFSDVAVSGDALGESVTARVAVTGDEYQVVEGGWYRVLSLLIREQGT